MIEDEQSRDGGPRQLVAKPTGWNFNPLYVVIAVGIFLVIAVASSIINTQLTLKHEKQSAHTVADSFLADIRKQDATSAFEFGDNAFQQKYTEKELANLFKSLAPLIKENPATTSQVATERGKTQVVTIHYQFSNPTYYFAESVERTSPTAPWKLLNFSGSPDEAGLYKTQ